MGLLRGVARTAVVAGTASAVSGRVQRRQQQRWASQEDQAAQQQQAYAEPQYAQPAYDAPPPPAAVDPLEQLQKLGELKAQGILTDAEFEAQKAKILAG